MRTASSAAIVAACKAGAVSQGRTRRILPFATDVNVQHIARGHGQSALGITALAAKPTGGGTVPTRAALGTPHLKCQPINAFGDDERAFPSGIAECSVYLHDVFRNNVIGDVAVQIGRHKYRPFIHQIRAGRIVIPVIDLVRGCVLDLQGAVVSARQFRIIRHDRSRGRCHLDIDR